MKKRLDVLVTEGGHAQSREKAKAMIMSGIVYVDGIRCGSWRRRCRFFR